MDWVERKSNFQKLMNKAAAKYLEKNYKNALKIYYDALELAEIVGIRKKTIHTIKYMICTCLLESDDLNDLSEAVIILQKIGKNVKEMFPSFYYLLAKAHALLFRFEQGLHCIEEVETVLKKHNNFSVINIPGTNTIIAENKYNESWIEIKNMCLNSNVPDAVCKLLDCINVTKPYITPNTNIFLKDPAFSGLITVKCNNENQQCIFTYHPNCWNRKKTEIKRINNVSDKDIIGSICLTSTCNNNNISCKISVVEVIGKNGEIIQSTNVTDSNNINLLENALHKDIDNENLDTEILIVSDVINDNEVEECSIQNCLLLFFYDYIKDNFVKVCDVYTKFDEFNKNLGLKNFDILAFLLATKKIKKINKNELKLSSKSNDILSDDKKNTESKMNNNSEDLDSFYDELVNNNDIMIRDIESPMENIKDLTSNETVHESYKSDYDKTHLLDMVLDLDCDLNDDIFKPSSNVCTEVNNVSVKIEKNLFLYKEVMSEYGKDCFSMINNGMKLLEEEYKTLHDEIKEKDSTIESLRNSLIDVKKEFESVKEDNTNLKKLLTDLSTENTNLKKKINDFNNLDYRRQEVLKIFKEECNIIEDCIKSECQQKTNELEQNLKSEIKTKIELLKKCLSLKYSANRLVLNRYLDYYSLAINIMNKINNWMENVLDIRPFIPSVLKEKEDYIKKLLQDHKLQYSKLMEDLIDNNSIEKFKLSNININLPTIPNTYEPNINELIHITLIILKITHHNFIVHLGRKGLEFNKDKFIEIIKQVLQAISPKLLQEINLTNEKIENQESDFISQKTDNVLKMHEHCSNVD